VPPSHIFGDAMGMSEALGAVERSGGIGLAVVLDVRDLYATSPHLLQAVTYQDPAEPPTLKVGADAKRLDLPLRSYLPAQAKGDELASGKGDD
jgi:hypothetical protein